MQVSCKAAGGDEGLDVVVPEGLPHLCERVLVERAARRATRPAPSIHYDEQPAEQPKPTIEVSEAAARLAAALYR